MTGIVILNVVELTTGENYIRWTKKDGTEKEVMYYSCSRNKMKRGGFCDYSANLKKTDIEPLVVGVLKQIMNHKNLLKG